ncbi:hypothetical protein A1O3_05312 [Capronia epimyces CBS 606.96]|uniref:Uncharacterized protein n=1 Tax=Capronia epimyces CBS 606.96 TaxID=1182542 RepID=W9XVP6_9EURO|nr:uncharacterized protein A1O3_05312 [Capronia epimyces CBS 606.96]EXJ84642.1 hypothetical protein A1O3_05312 [Capronia epimyces CBS 606.96]
MSIPPTSSPFIIQVTGVGSKLHRRATVFLTFVDGEATPDAYQDEAAVFVLTADGQLVSGGAYVGTKSYTGTSPLVQLAPPQAAGYRWIFDGMTLRFGNTTFVAFPDGQLDVLFGDSLPPDGTVPYASTDVDTGGSKQSTKWRNLDDDFIRKYSYSQRTFEFNIAQDDDDDDDNISVTFAGSDIYQLDQLRVIYQLDSKWDDNQRCSVIGIFCAESRGRDNNWDHFIDSCVQQDHDWLPKSFLVICLFIQHADVSFDRPDQRLGRCDDQLGHHTDFTLFDTSSIEWIQQQRDLLHPSYNDEYSYNYRYNDKYNSSSITTTTTTSSTTSSPSSSSSSPSTTTTTTTTTTSTSSPTPTIYPAKRGLAYTNVTTLVYYPPPAPYIRWSYNYYSLPNASDDVGPYPAAQFRFIPLLYNDASSLTSIWASNVNTSIASYGTDAIFGFNEPDACYSGQSACMSVSRTVQGYLNYIQPFSGHVLIGAPAVTNSGSSGLSYLSQFLGNATQLNLTVDFVNLHWYASPYNIQYFMDYLTQAYTQTGQSRYPVWVSEFGMDRSDYPVADVVAFLKAASAWMDLQPWVARYAWFGNFASGVGTEFLLNADGSGRSGLGDVWYGYNGTG